MSSCEGCSKADSCRTESGSCMMEFNKHGKVKKIIGVMSGKGGVGKSTVSAGIARALAKKGYSVGILDADVTGPSIPKMFGLEGVTLMATDEMIIPAHTEEGIKVVSLNLLIDDENSPVLWRGPMLSGLVKQFWTDVNWENLDYLVVDMPPGTSDVALTVFQSIPVDGVVTVTIPNHLVSMVVSKSISMAESMGIRNIGIINNMSYLKCGSCDDKIYVFNSEHDMKRETLGGVNIIGNLPITGSLLYKDDIFTTEFGDEMLEITDEIVKSV